MVHLDSEKIENGHLYYYYNFIGVYVFKLKSNNLYANIRNTINFINNISQQLLVVKFLNRSPQSELGFDPQIEVRSFNALAM